MFMRTLSVFVLSLTVACATLGQDDPIETRRIPIRFLTHQPADAFGTLLGLGQDAIGNSLVAEREWGLLTPEELVDVLKKDVAPASWAAPDVSLEIEGEHLVAVARRSVLSGISSWLLAARQRHTRNLVLDAALVVVPFERWGRVPPGELLQGALILKTARMTAVSGQRVVAQELTQQSYVRDFDVQISNSASLLSPVVDVLSTGIRIDLRPWLSPDKEAVIFEVRSEAAGFEALEDKTIKLLRLEPAAPSGAAAAAGGVGAVSHTPWEGHLQLPRTTFDQIRGQVAAKIGETVVAAAASRSDGILALLLTPTLDSEKPAPLAAESPTCLYEVDALATSVQDWRGPRVELLSPERGGTGELTGSQFTLDEPRAGFGLEALKDELRTTLSLAKAPPRESAVESAGWRTLVVRGEAPLQASVARRLKEVYQREVRTLTTEAAILGFKPGARAEWAKQVAALRPGGSRATDDELSRLLEAAAKGGEVRLAAFLGIAGRPGQRVHALSGRQQAYVADYSPQVGAASGVYDPIIGILMTGIGLDARPTPRASDGTFDLKIRVWTLSGTLEDKPLSTDATPVQCPRVTGFIWEPEVVCAPGHWTLAALESRGSGPALEEIALFVRVR
jgi:hypothetical protein